MAPRIHFKPFRFGRAEIITIAALVGVLLLTLGIIAVPWIASGYAAMTRSWTHLALKYGLMGAFLSAFLGSVTPVIVFPYTIVIVFLATQGLNPWLLGLYMGLGAGMGQFSGYLIGLWSAHYLEERKATHDALERLIHARPLYVQWILFVFAVTPLPDAALFIPLGMLRFGWYKILIPSISGKIVSGLLVTLSSVYLARSLNIDAAASSTTILGQIGSIIVVALVIYLLFKLDWEKMIHRWLDPKGQILPTGPEPHA